MSSIDDLKTYSTPTVAFEHAAPLCYFKNDVDTNYYLKLALQVKKKYFHRISINYHQGGSFCYHSVHLMQTFTNVEETDEFVNNNKPTTCSKEGIMSSTLEKNFLICTQVLLPSNYRTVPWSGRWMCNKKIVFVTWLLCTSIFRSVTNKQQNDGYRIPKMNH